MLVFPFESVKIVKNLSIYSFYSKMSLYTGDGSRCMHQRRFATYTWIVLVYNLAVILWGAFVRATGSGAGCGAHWPRCNGEVIPRAPSTETLIEFTHRLTSGIVLVMVVILVIWAWRAYPRGHRVRLGALWSLIFTIIEALVGAGLVLFELVADNDSTARAVSMAVHLVNTFLLLAAVTLTAWWASGGPAVRLKHQGVVGWLLGLGFAAMLVVGASGAVTALGDTLFPAESLAEGLREKFSPTAHLLIRLRVLHPVLAIATGFYLFFVARLVSRLRPDPAIERFARATMLLFAVQLVAGAVNVALLAPVWMQLLHLLLADLVWITLVLLAASALSHQPVRVASVSHARPSLQG